MVERDPDRFRLTVVNPEGRDREQDFEKPFSPGEEGHAPVNFHAYAACTGGSFHSDVWRAAAEETPVLVLLRGDFRASARAVSELKAAGRAVAVSLKETGLYQIAQQLCDASKLARFNAIVAEAHGCIGSTPEAANLYEATRGSAKGVAFIPTPYPVDDPAWNFSQPISGRSGIFVGTREWDVPSRNHLAALLAARQVNAATSEPVTVFNLDGSKGARLLRELNFPREKVRVLELRLTYPDYLREIARHKVVLQSDTSFVPGQVAGDALLCRIPCVGGNGAIDRLAFADSCGFGRSLGDTSDIAVRLLQNDREYLSVIADSQERATRELSFPRVAVQLEAFFNALDTGSGP